jgi:hypothetical protein
VPDIDIVDSTWICARPAAVAAVVAEPSNWRRWWPDLELAVDEWRGEKGVRWTVRRSGARANGTMEIWLEQAFDGVVAHYFLRLDGIDGRAMRPRRAARECDRYRRRMKRLFWALGDTLDPDRIARIGRIEGSSRPAPAVAPPSTPTAVQPAPALIGHSAPVSEAVAPTAASLG